MNALAAFVQACPYLFAGVSAALAFLAGCAVGLTLRDVLDAREEKRSRR